MAVANRNLNPGDRFTATYKKQAYHLQLTEEGKFVLNEDVDGTTPIKDRTYKSLSAAGSAIMGGIACNGWRFWTLADGSFMAEVQRNTMAENTDKLLREAGSAREEAMATDEANVLDESVESDAQILAAQAATLPNTPAKGKSAPKPRTFRVIQRVPNQKGLAEGLVRYFCRACMDGFIVEGGEAPTVCPKGHRTDDAELTSPATASA